MISLARQTTVVAVSPDRSMASHARLFAALEDAFPVSFQPSPAVAWPAAIVELGPSEGDPDRGEDDGEAAVPRIVFSPHTPGAARHDVGLGAAAALDRRLRGIPLLGQAPGPTLAARAEDHVLALERDRPRWTVSPGSVSVHRIALDLPELGPREVLRDALMSERSLSIVAIIHFLRSLCASSSFDPPPLRATIVFDDPNIRWRSYGFIDYQRLLTHADAHGYHAVMAMVPLDAVGTHAPTATLFRQRADRLSLAIHGNDHVSQELLSATETVSAHALCAQAIRRVRRFEARTGLSVDRVMIPPHGMCSESVATALAAFGFDALCAIHPEPWTEVPRDGHFLAGWEPATFSGPSAVIPRFPLYASRTEIALRAFMNNPLVLYGHHEDAASGLDLLEQAASRVNALGDVRWTSLGGLARSNFAVRVSDQEVAVRPYSRRVQLRIPERARSVVIEEPPGARGTLAGWSRGGGQTLPFPESAACRGGEEVEIRLRSRRELDPSDVPIPRWSPWATLRRAGTEARDRAMPLGTILAGGRSGG
jgi:hypothetical protein